MTTSEGIMKHVILPLLTTLSFLLLTDLGGDSYLDTTAYFGAILGSIATGFFLRVSPRLNKIRQPAIWIIILCGAMICSAYLAYTFSIEKSIFSFCAGAFAFTGMFLASSFVDKRSETAEQSRQIT